MAKQTELYDESLLRSEEIDEVIGRPPHWLIQWGITMFFVILMLVLALSYFIDYPEIVTVPFTINTDAPPLPEIMKENSRLVSLQIKEGALVHKYDTLFYYQGSTINKSAVLSPADGKIEFISPLNNGQLLTKGQTLFFVVPQSGRCFAAAYVNEANEHRINPGQHVILDLDQYPKQQYGDLNGVLSYVSEMGGAKGVYIKIALPAGTRSDIGKTIPLKSGLRGRAQVIINKRKLVYRLMNKIKI
jgi:hypothetical protein